MEETTNFEFNKPEKTDSAAISWLSANWEKLDALLAATPTTVNSTPVETGTRNIRIDEVPLADNLASDTTQFNTGDYIIRTSGGTASIEDGAASLMSIKGAMVKSGYVAPVCNMTVTPASESSDLSATIDPDTFFAEVSGASGTQTFAFTSAWSPDPEDYGITVTGTPASGDAISVAFVRENRGTITVATPYTFNSTGWNLYDNSVSYARVVDYSDDYGYKIGGSYVTVEFSETLNGERTTIAPVSGLFAVPADGYVFVTGGDATTYIYATWSDWQEGYAGDFEGYTVSTIDFTSVMVDFPFGLAAIGETADELNFNTQTAISRIGRLGYSAENLETVIAMGVPYDTDTGYIYYVRPTPTTTTFSVSPAYTVSDHGLEFLTGTTIPCECVSIYGNDLKNKLIRDVVTKSQDFFATDMPMSPSDSTTVSAELTLLNGMPEIVSNSNGTAYKYPNGFMICTKKVTASSHAINVAWGSCYESASSISLGSWAVSFTATPIEQATVGQGTAIGCWLSRVDGASKTSAGQISVIRPNSSTGKVVLDVVGFGMWK